MENKGRLYQYRHPESPTIFTLGFKNQDFYSSSILVTNDSCGLTARLQACWGACEGIPTELLSPGALGLSDTKLAGTANVRDELLSALKEMCAEFRGHDLPYGSAAYEHANSLINRIERGEA